MAHHDLPDRNPALRPAGVWLTARAAASAIAMIACKSTEGPPPPIAHAPPTEAGASAATVAVEPGAAPPMAPFVPPNVSKKCVPRANDRAPRCDGLATPSAGDRVKGFSLDGPDTGGDQGHVPPVCLGLLLETEYVSGLRCRQTIGSFDSIGIMGGGPVWIDDEVVCFRLTPDALEVRRAHVTIARVPRKPGMETAQAFPERCKD